MTQKPTPDTEACLMFLVATTWNCNLNCSYCFVESSRDQRDSHVMTPAMASRIIEAIDQVIVPGTSAKLHLYGGEPLTNLPAMAALVEGASKKPGRFTFGITTNGTIISDRIVSLLREGAFEISLSIDGPPEIHDACRRTLDGSPTHETVMAFLETIRRRTSCRVRGSSVVRPGWRLSQASKYLREIGIKTFKAQSVRVAPESPFHFGPVDRAHYLADLEQTAAEVIQELSAGEIPADGRFTCRVMQHLARVPARPSFCDVGRGSFGILPSGDVVPCVLIYPPEKILGHIEDDPSTWLEEGLRWRQSIQQRPECTTCDQLGLCGGGCPAIMPVCGQGECDLIRKECELSTQIYERFEHQPEALLRLVGIR